MPLTLKQRLAKCSATNVHDVLGRLGHEACALPPEICPLDPQRKVVGEAFTVSGHTDYTIGARTSVLRWAQMLSEAPAGHVLVCQPNTHEIAMMGEFSAQALQARGILGYVVDGRCRDVEAVIGLGFPVFCIGNATGNAVGRWTPDRFGEPVTIGSVTICAGDWLLGDRDGVVVIPASLIEQVVRGTEEVVIAEDQMRKDISGGMDPYEAYLKHTIDGHDGP